MIEFDRLLVAVASEDDAHATAKALNRASESPDQVTVVYVVEKAGGAPDKAGVEQREAAAEEIFAAFRETFDGDADSRIVFDTDVVDGIVSAAAAVDADAIVFTPRGGGLFARLLSGNVARNLLDRSDRPVVALPSSDR